METEKTLENTLSGAKSQTLHERRNKAVPIAAYTCDADICGHCKLCNGN